MLGILLSNLLYIGERNRQNQVYNAAVRAGELMESGKSRQEAISQAAAEKGVSSSDVSNLRSKSVEFEKTPENYVSQASPDDLKYYVTEEGHTTYRAKGEAPAGSVEVTKGEYDVRREIASSNKPVKVMYEGKEATARYNKKKELVIEGIGFKEVISRQSEKAEVQSTGGAISTVSEDVNYNYIQSPMESASSYYKNQPFQIYGQWFEIQRPPPPPLTVEEYKPEGFVGTLSLVQKKSSQIAKSSGRKGLKGVPKEVAFGTMAFSVGAVKSFYTTVRHPIQTAKGMASIVTNFPESGYEIGDQLRQDPYGTAGEFYGVGKGIKTYGKLASPILKRVSVDSVKIRTAKGEQVVYRGFSYQGKPILGIVHDLKSKPIFDGTVPVTKAETFWNLEIAKSRSPGTEILKRDLSLELMKRTEKTRSKYISRFPKETKTLSKKGVDIVKKFTKEEGALAYGSYTAEAQLPKGALAKGRGQPPSRTVIGDIDLQLRVGLEESTIKAASLVKKLRSAGENVRVARGQPTLIESKAGGEWHHAVDIHSIDTPLDPNIPLEGGFGFKFGQRPEMIEGIKSMRLSEFGLRKGSSSLTLRDKGKEITSAPEPHRMKDIPDFLTSQEYLLKSKGIRGLPGLNKLNQLKDLYKKEGKLNIKDSSIKVELSPKSSKPAIGKAPSIGITNVKDIDSISLSPGIASESIRSRSIGRSSSRSSSLIPSKSASISVSASLGGSSFSPPSPSPSPRSGSPSPSPSPSPRSGSPSPSPSPSPRSGSPSPSPRPGFPSSPPSPVSSTIKKFRDNISKKFGKSFGIKQPKKYTPSTTSVLLGIKGKPTTTGVKSGLGIRPIIEEKKNKKFKFW